MIMHLVLNTFGSSLQKENDIFVIYHNEESKRIAPSKIRSISISRGARISSDAALLALEHEIDVLFIDKIGKPAGRLWSVKYGSISTIRKQQLNFSRSPQAVGWIKEIIKQKIDNQTALLLSLHNEDPQFSAKIESTCNKLEDYKTKINQLQAPFINDIAATLRGWEGAAAKNYFAIIAQALPQSYKFETRTAHPARDVFNMLLNYAYGMLYGKVEGALIRAGIDPYLGVFHRDEYNRPVFVYDIIEKYRVWADYVVVSLCMQEIIDRDCYSIRDGAHWLESMGKRILIQSVNDYLDEVVNFDGNDRSRSNHIELYAQKLANQILHYKVKM